jgi:hypothetical protein
MGAEGAAMADRQFDLTRDTLAVVWATMIVVATWPLLLMLQRWLLGKRWLA